MINKRLALIVSAIVSISTQFIYPALSRSAELNTRLIKVTQDVMPAIVHLKIKRKMPAHLARSGRRAVPNPFDDFFKGPGVKPPVISETVGSGVIVSPLGYIVTNNHVIEDAEEIIVKLDNNEEYPAKIIGSDKHSDLAVIQFAARRGSYKVARLGNSDRLKVGEVVLALGSPFGLRKSVTQGIVSAIGRKNVMGFRISFIQTDAAINPGNSGGALVNLRGELVGINSLILARSISPQTAGFQGIGLAIPINLVKKVMTQIIKNGKVIRGFLGVQPANPNESLSKKLQVRQGVLVSLVIPDSPADKAKLMPWDHILKVNNTNVRDFDHLREVISDSKVGQRIAITYFRKGKLMKTLVVIADLDEVIAKKKAKKVTQPPKKPEPLDRKDPTLGLQLKPLTPTEKAILGKEFKIRYGALVLAVKPNSLGAKNGFSAGDVILEVEGEEIKSPATFHALVRKFRAKAFFRVRLLKRGRFVILPVTL